MSNEDLKEHMKRMHDGEIALLKKAYFKIYTKRGFNDGEIEERWALKVSRGELK